MRIHHLNCGTMRPWGAPEGLVCHVLLVETATGLVLVDSGLGLDDRAAPGTRFGAARHFVRPAFDAAETAVRQLPALGFDPRDVRDIVLTHFDADHVGGAADFPWARIHLTADEATAALHPATRTEKARYRPAQRSHRPTLIHHTARDSETWRGFAAATELTAVSSGIVLIGLPGHTRGHAAVAVDAGDHWILHAGDAFYHRGQIDGSADVPRSLLAMERAVAHDWRTVRANHERLSELRETAGPDLLIVNAHDPGLLTTARVTSTS